MTRPKSSDGTDGTLSRAVAERPLDDGHCFVCGPHNPIGLHLRFVRDHEADTEYAVKCDLILASIYQGWQGIAHGGIVMALLDEAMAYAIGEAGFLGMTAGLSVRFRKPVPIDRPIVVKGRVAFHRGGVFGLEGAIEDERGATLASGEGKFVSRGALTPGQRLGVQR